MTFRELFSDQKWRWLLSHPISGGVEKEDDSDDDDDSDGLNKLIKEGSELPEDDDSDESDDDDDKGDKEGEKDKDDDDDDDSEDGDGDDDESLSARLEALESKLAEKDAEILFYRQELSKRNEPKTSAKDEPLYDIEDLAKQLTHQDPKVAAKAVVDLAEKIADRKFKDAESRTSTMVRDSAAVAAAKDADRTAVLADFSEELEDRTVFVPLMERIFKNINQAAGHYVKDSLYTAAATARTIIEKQKAKNAAGRSKNGVREVRAARESDAGIEANTNSFANVRSIADIPDRYLKPSEKAAARAAAKKMGVSEKEWVKNFIAEKTENPNFG
jgi:hypothetical protein